MDNLHPVVTQLAGFQGGPNFVLFTNEQQGGNFLVRIQRAFDAFDDNPATGIATHDIHCNSHKWKERGMDVIDSAGSERIRLPL